MHRYLLAPALLFAVVGCREDAFGPTEPAAVAADGAVTSEITTAAQNTWTRRADMWGIERTDMAVAVVTNAARERVLYAMGGATTTGGTLSRVMAYNATTNTWTLKAEMPIPLKATNGAVVINGKIYLSGGLVSKNDKSYSARLLVYDPVTNTWARKSDMPTFGLNGVSGVIDGMLYVVTSCADTDYCSTPGQWLLRYDPTTDTWIELATPTADLWYHSKAVGGTIGKKIYIGTPGSSTLHVYDPGTDTWTQKQTSLTVPHGAASTTFDAQLYVMGGYRVNPDRTTTAIRSTNVYDPATNTWTTKAPLPSSRVNASAARLAVNGQPRIELVGGPRPGNNLQYAP
jgi:N-acetylneuraminic acid mutarotase